VKRSQTFSKCSEWRVLNSFSKNLLKRASSLFSRNTTTIRILGFHLKIIRNLLFPRMLLNSLITSVQTISEAGSILPYSPSFPIV
jgi:ABC-type polysaccharide transport system permease subunit